MIREMKSYFIPDSTLPTLKIPPQVLKAQEQFAGLKTEISSQWNDDGSLTITLTAKNIARMPDGSIVQFIYDKR